MIKDLVEFEPFKDEDLQVCQGQNLSVDRSCLIITDGLFVQRVFLELTHHLLVENSELETIIKGLVGKV